MDGLYSLAGKGNKTREQNFYHSEIITGEYNKKHHFSVKNMKNRRVEDRSSSAATSNGASMVS
jgi:hypothetical protein